MGQITWFSKRWARLPGFAKIWARLPGEKIVFFCKKWTRLPGGPDYLVAAHSGPDYLGAAKSGPDYLDRCFRVFFAVSLPSLVGGKPAGPDYLVAAQSGPDYLGAAKWGADYLEFTLFLAALRPARTLFARTAPPATPRSPGRPRRLVSLWSSRELAPRGRAEAPCSAAPRVSTARAAGGRAVCVAPLWASAWSCAERVGGALTRAPRARMGTRRNRAARARTSTRFGAASFGAARRLRSWCAPWPCRACSHRGRSGALRLPAPTHHPPAPPSLALGTVAPRSRTSRLAPHALITPHIHPHRPCAFSSPVVCPWEPPK